MKVLVTGAAGFVDDAVAALLVDQGHEVVGLIRSDSSALPQGVHRVRGDLSAPETLPDAVAEVEGVCHLAGRTRVRESRTDPVGYWRVNVGGTLALLTRPNCGIVCMTTTRTGNRLGRLLNDRSRGVGQRVAGGHPPGRSGAAATRSANRT